MFGNQKGGVGKSQCSVLLATALAQPPFNLKVTLIDLDDQKSVVAARKLDKLSYTEGVEAYPILDKTIEAMQDDIVQLDAENHIIIIDAAGKTRHAVGYHTTRDFKITDVCGFFVHAFCGR